MTWAAELPEYRDIVELPREWGPVTVPASFEDGNGHMNVRHYFDLCLRAIDAVFDRIGFTDEYRAGRAQGFFTAEHHIGYHSETHVDDQVSVYLRILDRSDKAIHTLALLVNDTTGKLACTLELLVIHVDMTTRRPVAFAADIAAAIDREIAAGVAEWDAPTCGAMGIRRRPASTVAHRAATSNIPIG
jgi:acyl-CoA thioester hydrolase